MTFTLIDLNAPIPSPPPVRGLKLAEAFTRLLALNGYNYSFKRRPSDQAMQLLLMKTPGVRELPFQNEIFIAIEADDEEARREIMEAVIGHRDWPDHAVVMDDWYDRQRASRRPRPA